MLHNSQLASESNPQTFRTFVTGPHNALAYNAAVTVARSPGTAYNPLFLNSEPGMGKTHLLHSIASYLRPRLGGAEVIVVSADTFAQEFNTHIRRGHMLAFRRRYRRAGALLIDGISIMAGRETASEELVHTFDALREAGRQIVIADEARPSAIRGLPERLRSRLSSSLIAVINPPDEATRLSILRAKIIDWGIAVPDEALVVLANRIRGSVRDLEDALTRLDNEATMRSELPSVALAATIAADIARSARQPRGQAHIDATLSAVCDYYGIARAVLLGKSREMTVAQARQVTMYLLREDAGLTATQVGAEIGRDHSTVLHGHSRISNALGCGDNIMNVVLESIRKTMIRGSVRESA